MTRASRRAFAATVSMVSMVAAAVAGGCGSVEAPVASTGQNFSINQTSLLLVTGDSAVLAISPVPLEPAVQGTVRWTSSRPDVASIDSLVLIGEPAKVRAKAAGTTTLTGTLTSASRTLVTTVPVRVGSG